MRSTNGMLTALTALLVVGCASRNGVVGEVAPGDEAICVRQAEALKAEGRPERPGRSSTVIGADLPANDPIPSAAEERALERQERREKKIREQNPSAAYSEWPLHVLRNQCYRNLGYSLKPQAAEELREWETGKRP